MKKLVFIIVLLFTAGNGYSQIGFGMGFRIPLGGGNGPQRGRTIEDHVQQMKHDLNLDKDQVQKVRSLLVERDRRRNGPNPMAAQEYNDRLKEILTPDQYKKLTMLRQQSRYHKQPQSPTNKADSTKSSSPQNNDYDDIYYKNQ